MKRFYTFLFMLVASTTTVAEVEEEFVPQAIDLGLPSGTLWATCNIGASFPEAYGNYFYWGEMEPPYTKYTVPDG
ncbi:MAG: hypothetical protein J6Y82_08205 [Bacteroidales bacterium]|nr:hypothetical protein [Bacteroidales bacterium]